MADDGYELAEFRGESGLRKEGYNDERHGPFLNAIRVRNADSEADGRFPIISAIFEEIVGNPLGPRIGPFGTLRLIRIGQILGNISLAEGWLKRRVK